MAGVFCVLGEKNIERFGTELGKTTWPTWPVCFPERWLFSYCYVEMGLFRPHLPGRWLAVGGSAGHEMVSGYLQGVTAMMSRRAYPKCGLCSLAG